MSNNKDDKKDRNMGNKNTKGNIMDAILATATKIACSTCPCKNHCSSYLKVRNSGLSCKSSIRGKKL
ncbi:hypothetical protein [Methanothermococcus okinawensis]|uniref:Uncharacterized protein n=1 Tax=Methanothermococcus okinawensis (strain DSM 14208 / JCM 11175 / IH1) TaxID=647113 RepID=F8AK93_METOI|nr:hypothetical protein [Methanothermococcus okinawensis]AEH07466.1 hypothetical protein Metok_1503 [Methanothermococcus okinawensis IH1]